MNRSAASDGARGLLLLIARLWPLLLSWQSWRTGSVLWRDAFLLPATGTSSYHRLFQLWPSASLAGPVVTLLIVGALHRADRAARATAIASLAGVGLAVLFMAIPEVRALAPFVGRTPPLALVETAAGHLYALVAGVLAFGMGIDLLWGKRIGRLSSAGLRRGASDNYGHADWLPIADARNLYPGPNMHGGGIVIGEAYRVDEDRGARGRFLPAEPKSWGRGGTAPLLIDPCRDGSTHGLVIAGSGGFKTSGTGIPTLLHWRSSAVVLDPSREMSPMVAAARATQFAHRVIALDPSEPDGAGFNALDWIEIAAPLAETNVEAVATWLAGEPPPGGASGGAEFFRDMGRTLIACLLADLLWDEAPHRDERTLRGLRARLVKPESELRKQLGDIHIGSASSLARDYAGTLMGLVEETFSGVYANATQATRWLSTAAYADLVSGTDFRTADLAGGMLSVFVQIPLKTLEATPGLGRVIIGSLLNAAYEADGQVNGRILFLLDEVARLGPMRVLATARDAGRKYGLTLLLLYQSVGQLVEQWGKDGARAWYDSVSWRLYAAVSDPETARDLSEVCGEHAVLATSHGDTRGQQRRAGGGSSSGRSENRSEIKRALIKPDELLHDVRTDEAFVIRRGSRPLRCGRAIWFRRPEMQALVEASRFNR